MVFYKGVGVYECEREIEREITNVHQTKKETSLVYVVYLGVT